MVKAAILERATFEPLGSLDSSRYTDVASFLVYLARLDRTLSSERLILLESLVCARRVPEVHEALHEAHAQWLQSLGPFFKHGVEDASIDPELSEEAIAVFLRVFGIGATLYRACGLPAPSEEAWSQVIRRVVHALGPGGRVCDEA